MGSVLDSDYSATFSLLSLLSHDLLHDFFHLITFTLGGRIRHLHHLLGGLVWERLGSVCSGSGLLRLLLADSYTLIVESILIDHIEHFELRLDLLIDGAWVLLERFPLSLHLLEQFGLLVVLGLTLLDLRYDLLCFQLGDFVHSNVAAKVNYFVLINLWQQFSSQSLL